MHDRTLDRPPVLVLAAISAAICLSAHEVRAVSCPGSGAKVKVVVHNPTGSTVSGLTVALSGSSITSQITCTSATGTYSHNLTSLAPGDNEVYLPTSGGLVTGMWKHHIEVSTTGQEQHQKGVTLYASSQSDYSVVRWTYYPNVVSVNVSGSSGTSMSDCPVNTVTDPATCDVNEAILRANDNGTSRPVLIQFNVSPGALNKDLTITAADVTLDGTDADGNPWIVGDPNAFAAGRQDSFPRVLDFPYSKGMRVEANNVSLIGLELSQSGGNPSQNLFWLPSNDPTGVVLRNVKLDGNTDDDCFAIGGSCTTTNDVVKVAGRNSAPGSPSLRMVNVEVAGAIDKGVDLGDNTWAQVVRSWIHNNYEGNVSAGEVHRLDLEESAIDRAGLRPSDDKAVSHFASGLDVANGFVESKGTLYRNNLGFGVRASGLADVRPEKDWWCGNDADGFYVAESGGFLPSVTSFGGVGAAYNAGHGVSLEEDDFTVQSMNNQSVFLSNEECGFLPRASLQPISAVNNQWRTEEVEEEVVYPDVCESEYGSVDIGTPLDHEDDEIAIDGVSPSNVLLGGQTVRVMGANFNAVHGNPLAGDAGCDTGVNSTGGVNGGQDDSCCTATTRANVCGNGTRPDPVLEQGQCVEFKWGTGSWSSAVVKGLTPAMLETEVPGSVFGCLGGSDEVIRVSKRRRSEDPSSADKPFCTTAVPF